jgi:hypothetical protein
VRRRTEKVGRNNAGSGKPFGASDHLWVHRIAGDFGTPEREMSLSATRFVAGLGAFVLCLGLANFARAQAIRAAASGGTLSGTVVAGTGSTIPNAKVSVKNSAGEVATETQTDAGGHYSVANLAPGDYDVTVSADGYGTGTTKVTIAAGAGQTADITLNAPLSLGDLGFSTSQTQGSAADQARLDKRSHMLKLHQRFGLIDAIPMAATVATSFGAGGRSTSTSARWAHLALGSATGDLYFTSAYFAIFAPKIHGTQVKGPIRVHKVLAWVHGPGMILTPILGAIAFDQKSKGERVHGIASAHGAVAIVTAGAFGASILALTFKW